MFYAMKSIVNGLVLCLWCCTTSGYNMPILPPASLGTIPQVIFQVGRMRTSTTLQFMTLCGAVATKHIDNPDVTVSCFHLTKNVTFTTPPPNHYWVIKSHGGATHKQLHDIARLVGPNRSTAEATTDGDAAWIFYTTYRGRLGKHSKVTNFVNLGMPSPLVVDTSKVVAHGHLAERKRYVNTFQLSDSEARTLFSYLEYWDALRLCCGEQMASRWRVFLHNGRTTKVAIHENSKYFSNEAPIRFCRSVNITSLELSLLQTDLFEKMHRRVPTLARLSTVDGEMTGTYCRTCNRNVQLFKLDFNVNCSQTLEQYCDQQPDNEVCLNTGE